RKVYSVEANSFVIIPQSTSQMVKVGGLAEFGVITSSEADSFQWLKNSKPVKGAMSVPLKFNPVSLKDAGSYTVQAKLDSQTETSDVFLLGVVEDFEKSLVVQQGKAVKLSVVAAGVDLKYEWRLDDQPLEDDDSVSGGKTKTLQIKGIQASQSGTYSCEVKTGSSDGTVGATTYVSVFDQKPQVSPTQNMSDGIVGGAFSHVIVYDEAPEMMPISFSAKGLPSGVKINSKTGEITGRPTKPGIYKIIVIAKNNFGSTEAEQTIEVKAFPENLAGNYVGWLGRHESLNQMLGGRLDMKISTLGSLSGSLMMGTQKLAFKGNLEIVADDSELPYAEIYIQPKGNPTPELLKLEFSVDTDSQELSDAQVLQGESGLDVVGWRQKWSAKGEPATSYLGLHTFGLRLPEPGPLINDAAIPQGWGFGSFSPSADGKVKLVGQTADGEKFINASFLGPQGEVLLFQTLYKTPIKGSLLGVMTIDVGSEVDLEDTSDNNLSGTVTWTRPEDKQSKARLYKAGFGLVDTPVEEPLAIEVVGASFVSPSGSTGVILNLDAGTRIARVDFDFGGIESASKNPDQELNIAAKSKITSFDPSDNPSGLKLAANVKTALLTGGFKLEDDDLRTGMTKSVKRSVKVQGMLIRDGEDFFGVGYFLLPGLPTDETPVLTDILSGKMTLRENILLP
ncbi:MAG: immunoglobulin domain-containing protein, partial [Prosthecobacter sp.]|nr:immunoglobulin domain-containing protein [Prosthecobacter sp.]